MEGLREIDRKLGKLIGEEISDEEISIPQVLIKIDKLEELLKSKNEAQEAIAVRVNNILNVVMAYAKLDYSKKAPLTNKKDHLDALSAGINMLGEEIQASTISLQEKEILLKEIHHRVKNNLQIISSLLNLQSETVSDQNSYDQLKESINRVKTMALVHEKLYESVNLSHVDFCDYMKTLVRDLNQSYNLDLDKISLQINIDSGFRYLDIDTAIPCGLILNELLSNSYKYAFPGKRKGNVYVYMGIIENNKMKYRLKVQDDGIGIPEQIEIENIPTLGLQLVEMLTKQLGGLLTLERKEGTLFMIEFPGN